MSRNPSTPSLVTRARHSPWQVGGALLLVWASLMLVMTGSAVLMDWRYARDGQAAQAIGQDDLGGEPMRWLPERTSVVRAMARQRDPDAGEDRS
jgi:hypothetical protein